MSKTRCRYCHEHVSRWLLPFHEIKHLKLRADGQQTDYVTLPEEEREQGDLSDVPSVYVHHKCGIATGMPEEIIRTYLKNPYIYSADATYCCGCNTHVPNKECEWTETGENLQTYMDRLRAAKPELKPKPYLLIALCIFIPLGIALKLLFFK